MTVREVNGKGQSKKRKINKDHRQGSMTIVKIPTDTGQENQNITHTNINKQRADPSS